LQVEGLRIRHAEPEDYRDAHEIFSGPRAFAGTLQLPFPSLEHWRKRFAEPDAGFYGLVAVAGDHVVGWLGLQTFPDRPRRRHAGTVGLVVHDEWQGKGIGKALLHECVEMADRWLNLKRLELEVYTDNEPAIRLYERFGFEREGTLRQYAFRDGRYVDVYQMARLQPAAQ